MALRVYVVPPRDAGAAAAFLDLPARLHGADPRWIPPLRATVAADLRREGPFWRRAEAQFFVAELDGTPVGRIAAIATAGVRDEEAAPLGQVGYFESIDDVGVTRALVDAALPWLAARGARRVLGPMNGGAHRAHRFMTAGFDTEPFLLEPRNPPSYPRLFEAAGFAPVARWRSHEIDRSWLGRVDRFLAGGAASRSTYDAETFDPAERSAFLGRLVPLVNAIFAERPGFAPLSAEELLAEWGPILAVAAPGDVGVIREAGRDVGLWVNFPDWANEVRALAGDASGWGRWIGRAEADRLIVYLVGLVPDAARAHERLELGRIVLAAVTEWTGSPFERAVLALSDERIIRWVSLPAARRYALYGRAIG